MASEDKRAFWKGYADGQKARGRDVDILTPVRDFFHPPYNPPSGREEPYREGFRHGESEGKR